MADNGLSEIVQADFAGVPKMKNGKNFSRNVRAVHLIAGELL